MKLVYIWNLITVSGRNEVFRMRIRWEAALRILSMRILESKEESN